MARLPDPETEEINVTWEEEYPQRLNNLFGMAAKAIRIGEAEKKEKDKDEKD